MTTQQSEALRLADICATKGLFAVEDELRRLHAESEQHLQELRSYRITVGNREARIAQLENQLAAAVRNGSTGMKCLGHGFRCADCKTPLVQGYTCGACGSDLAEDA